MSDALLARIKQVLVDSLDLGVSPADLPDDLSLVDRETRGIDSVEAVALVLGLEQEFGIRFSEVELDLERLSSPPGIAEMVRDKLEAGGRAHPAHAGS